MKTALNSSILTAVWIFLPAARAAPNRPDLKIHTINVAQYTLFTTLWLERNGFKRLVKEILITKL